MKQISNRAQKKKKIQGPFISPQSPTTLNIEKENRTITCSFPLKTSFLSHEIILNV